MIELRWIKPYKDYKVGDIGNTANVRPQVSKKRAIPCISQGNKACITHKIDLMSDCKGNTQGGLK